MAFPIPLLPTGIPQEEIKLIKSTKTLGAETGLYTEVESEPETIKGAVLPLSQSDLMYSEGTYTRDDRKIYVETTIEINSIVEFQGERFTVDKEDNYSGLTQTEFRRYFIKRRRDNNR